MHCADCRRAVRDEERTVKVALCGPCNEVKKSICGGRCSGCRKAKRHLAPRSVSCAKCTKKTRIYYILPKLKNKKKQEEEKICEKCRAVQLLVERRQVLLNFKATAPERRAWVMLVRFAVRFRVDVLLVWDGDCLYILIRIICWARFGRRLALLNRCPKYLRRTRRGRLCDHKVATASSLLSCQELPLLFERSVQRGFKLQSLGRLKNPARRTPGRTVFEIQWGLFEALQRSRAPDFFPCSENAAEI